MNVVVQLPSGDTKCYESSWSIPDVMSLDSFVNDYHAAVLLSYVCMYVYKS